MKWTHDEIFQLCLWTLATTFGITLLRFALFANVRVLVSGILITALMALSQWSLVLRNRIKHSGWWVLITVVGWILAYYATPTLIEMALNLQLLNIIDPIQSVMALNGLIIGLFLGLAQWILLRFWVKRASLWLLLNILAFTLGFFIFAQGQQMAFQADNVSTSEMLENANAIIGSFVISSLTGIGIIYLLRQKRQFS
jgi:hypothetical protein